MRQTRASTKIERVMQTKLFQNPFFHIYQEDQSKNLCVLQSINIYLQCQYYEKIENFLEIYAWSRKESKEKLRKEIQKIGIRLFNLHKVAYDQEQKCFYKSQLHSKITQEQIDDIVDNDKSIDELFNFFSIDNAIIQYQDMPRIESLVAGDKGPLSKTEYHTCVIRKIKGKWWLFDSANQYPKNLTDDKNFALNWITHFEFIDIVTLVHEIKTSEQKLQQDTQLFYQKITLQSINKTKKTRKVIKKIKNYDKYNKNQFKINKLRKTTNSFVKKGPQKKDLVKVIFQNQIKKANITNKKTKTLSLKSLIQNGKLQ